MKAVTVAVDFIARGMAAIKATAQGFQRSGLQRGATGALDTLKADDKARKANEAAAAAVVKNDKAITAMGRSQAAAAVALAKGNGLTNAQAAAAGRAAMAQTRQNATSKVAAQMARDQAEAAHKASQRIQVGQLAVAGAYAFTTAKIMGYVRSGLAGTTMGERMGRNFEFLNREIAQLFLPAIEKVNRGLEKTVLWFRSLSGEQQNAIGKWSGITVGMLGILTIGPKVAGAFSLIGAAMKASLVAHPFIALAAGIGGVLASTEAGREKLMNFGRSLSETFGRVAEGIKEKLGPTFERLREPAMKFFDSLMTAVQAVLPLVEKLASAFLTAFGKVLTLFVDGLIPILKGLTELFSSAGGKWILYGVVFLVVANKIVGAVKMLTMAFTTLKGAMFFGIPLLIGLFAGLSGSAKDTKNHIADVSDLIKGVRAGDITAEEAKKTAKERGEDTESQKGLEIAQKLKNVIEETKGVTNVSLEEALEKLRSGTARDDSGMTGVEKLAGGVNLMKMKGLQKEFDDLSKEQREAGAQQGSAIDVAAKKAKDKSQLTMAGGKYEDPRETIRRLQSTALKTEITPEEKLLAETKKLMEQYFPFLKTIANKPTGAAP